MKDLKAKIIYQRSHDTGDLIQNEIPKTNEVYVYSEVPFFVWFKVDDEWFRASEEEHRLGIRATPPEGSTHYYIETTEQDQVVIGFDDPTEDFKIEEPEYW